MTGEQKGLMGLFGKFVSMDKMIGPDFEKGLARLKAVAEERRLTTAAPSSRARLLDHQGQTTVQVSLPLIRLASAWCLSPCPAEAVSTCSRAWSSYVGRST